MRKNLQVKHVSRACTMTPTAFFLAKFGVFHLILDLITAVNSNNSIWIASFTMCCLSGVSQWMVDVCRTVSLDMQYILAVTLPQEKKKKNRRKEYNLQKGCHVRVKSEPKHKTIEALKALFIYTEPVFAFLLSLRIIFVWIHCVGFSV